MPEPRSTAWFRARTTLGFGWGLPLRWQGWLVLVVWLAGLVGVNGLLLTHPVAFIGFVVFWSALLVLICWWKGEAVRGRE